MNELDSTPSSRGLSGEESDVVDYRSVSRLALLTLLFGLLSTLSVVAPLFWVALPITLLLGLLALRSIAAAPDQLTGRGLVLAGLAVACFFGAFGPVRTLTRQHQVRTMARELVVDWFQMIADNKLMEAHQLRLPYNERPAADRSLDAHYLDESKKFHYDMFTKDSPTPELVVAGSKAVVRFLEDRQISSTGSNDVVVQWFEVECPQPDKVVTMKVEVTMTRRGFPGTAESRWEVSNCKVLHRTETSQG